MKDHDATERAHLNGQRYMKERIIEKLLTRKGKTLGLERAILSEIIEMVKKMEVRA